MKTKRILSVLTSTLLACNVLSASPIGAVSFSDLPLNDSLMYETYTETLDDADAVAAGHGGILKTVYFAGFVTRYTGTETETIQLGDKTLYFDYDAWAAQIEAKHYTEAIRIQTYAEFTDSEQYQNLSHLPDPMIGTLLDADAFSSTDDIYIVGNGLSTSKPQSQAEFYESVYALLQVSTRFEPLGAVYITVERYSDYNQEIVIQFASAEDVNAMRDKLSGYGEIGYISGSAETAVYLMNSLSLAEALSLCDELKTETAILDAYPECVVLDETDEPTSCVFAALSGTDVPEAVFGDVDGNGTVQIVDAQAALKAVAAIMVENTPEISPGQLEIANVDGIGTVTVKDAQYILIYAANTLSEIPTSWQELTGNPNAPVASN